MTDEELIAKMRLLSADHEPDGWPAVQMSSITHLLSIIDRQAEMSKELFRVTQLFQPPEDRKTVLTHILRNWSREDIVSFALHQLGDRCQECGTVRVANLESDLLRLRSGNTALIDSLMDMVCQHCPSVGEKDGLLYYDAGLSSNESALLLLWSAGCAEEVKGHYRLLWDKLEERKKHDEKGIS